MTEKGWLEKQLEDACTQEVADLQKVIDDNTPRLTAMTAMKTALFNTWWQLEKNDGESESDFRDRMEKSFDGQFKAGDIAALDS